MNNLKHLSPQNSDPAPPGAPSTAIVNGAAPAGPTAPTIVVTPSGSSGGNTTSVGAGSSDSGNVSSDSGPGIASPTNAIQSTGDINNLDFDRSDLIIKNSEIVHEASEWADNATEAVKTANNFLNEHGLLSLSAYEDAENSLGKFEGFNTVISTVSSIVNDVSSGHTLSSSVEYEVESTALILGFSAVGASAFLGGTDAVVAGLGGFVIDQLVEAGVHSSFASGILKDLTNFNNSTSNVDPTDYDKYKLSYDMIHDPDKFLSHESEINELIGSFLKENSHNVNMPDFDMLKFMNEKNNIYNWVDGKPDASSLGSNFNAFKENIGRFDKDMSEPGAKLQIQASAGAPTGHDGTFELVHPVDGAEQQGQGYIFDIIDAHGHVIGNFGMDAGAYV